MNSWWLLPRPHSANRKTLVRRLKSSKERRCRPRACIRERDDDRYRHRDYHAPCAFPLVVATSNEAGHGQDRALKKFIPAYVVLSAGPDEPSILVKPLAASQSIASTA